MCGITGVAGSLTLETLRSDVEKMTSSLRHRGPDADGYWIDPSRTVAFGHRRLSIIDTRDDANQPMVLPDSGHAIAFNGEIYNFKQLRSDLIAVGETFRTASDTEVLLRGIRQWGLEKTLRVIDGMFGFAYWDPVHRRLSLARDRFGEKPLVYRVHRNSLSFASEVRALLLTLGNAAQLDPLSLNHFFTFGVSPGDRSVIAGIKKVKPGTVVTFAIAQNGELRSAPEVHTYFDAFSGAIDAREVLFKGNPAEAKDKLQALLVDGIQRRMISDVPLGAFLSGGIDSSLVVAIMQSLSTRPVKTFTIGFDEKAFDEAPFARKVARHLGTDHTERYLSGSEVMSVIPDLAKIYDEPFADSSQIPTFLVSAVARKHVTVALSGDGGDEIFGGYTRYFLGADLWNKIRLVPSPLRRALAKGMFAIPMDRWDQVAKPLAGILTRRGVSGLPGQRAHQVANLLNVRSQGELYERLVSNWSEPVLNGVSNKVVTTFPEIANMSFVDRMMLQDTVSYLPDDILTKVDRAAMSVSLETRAPFLDPSVYEFAWSLPHNLRISDGVGKVILKNLLADFLPREIFERPKMGFGVPLNRWLRSDLRDWAESYLAVDSLNKSGLIDATLVRNTWNEHLSGQRDHSSRIWSVLMFQTWIEQNLNFTST